MREVAKDENHPLHDEALKQSKLLSEQLSPAMASLRKTVASKLGLGQVTRQLKDHFVLGLGADSAMADLMKAAEPIMSSTDIPAEYSTIPFKEPTIPNFPAIDNSELIKAAQERNNRERRQDEVATASLDVLQALEARMQQINHQIQSVDQRLIQSNSSAATSFRWTIAIASLTLLATIIGIVFTAVD